MAQRTILEIVDDLDGGQADETVAFALDGVEYEIDLSDLNAERLRESFATYVEHARRTGGRVQRGKAAATRSTVKGGRSDAGEIREWASENGYELAERGRIPTHVVAAFDQAQAGTKQTSTKGAAAKPATTKRASVKLTATELASAEPDSAEPAAVQPTTTKKAPAKKAPAKKASTRKASTRKAPAKAPAETPAESPAETPAKAAMKSTARSPKTTSRTSASPKE